MVYFDYSATTPVLPEIMDSLIKVTNEYLGNPNSLHNLGTKSKKLMNEAIAQIADIFKINQSEIVFTSGATEANNYAILGAFLAKGKKGSRIIVSKLEHDSIYGICEHLESLGYIVDYVKNDEEGLIDFEDLKRLITPETILVSICAVNSELGIRQPLKIIKQIINRENPNTLLHSDMTQAIGKISISLSDVDLASMSAHKIYGPKGIGLLYKKDNVKIRPLIYGNKKDFKPGTPALPLIASFSKALRITNTDINIKEEKVNKLNEKMCNILAEYPKLLINKTKYSIPHILNFSLMNIKPETLIHALEVHKIYVSSNTACASGKISNAVLNIYHDKTRALTTIRISLSFLTKNEEITRFSNIFKKVYINLSGLNHETV